MPSQQQIDVDNRRVTNLPTDRPTKQTNEQNNLVSKIECARQCLCCVVGRPTTTANNDAHSIFIVLVRSIKWDTYTLNNLRQNETKHISFGNTTVGITKLMHTALVNK